MNNKENELKEKLKDFICERILYSNASYEQTMKVFKEILPFAEIDVVKDSNNKDIDKVKITIGDNSVDYEFTWSERNGFPWLRKIA